VTSYRAEATRANGWWAVEVPEVPGLFTQTRRLDQVASVATEAIADLLEIDPGSITAVEVVVMDQAVREVIEDVTAALAALDEATTRARDARNRAARTLSDELRLPYRDIGQVLGVSHQRVGQLLADPEAGGPAEPPARPMCCAPLGTAFEPGGSACSGF
jgi:predicted RNase H-like HicB family nuclease